ncbi:MAG TPA: GNAT family N-acetyltransferase [Vicinamibacteria bacterium]|nr:GNAT family N-acetyltransferase [Vicinamibacteria bacterium]
MALEVGPVRGGRDLALFVGLPYELHRHDPFWTPPLRRDVRVLLSPEKNPFFRHGAAEHLLARRDGRVVGRISAIENRLHNEFHGDRVGFFGFFDCADDPEAASALLEAAATWTRRRGLALLRGPASFSTNEEAGLLVEGFDTPSVLMMPHNPPYYERLLEGAGLRKAKDLLAYQRSVDGLPDRLAGASELLRARYHVDLRPLDLARFDREVDVVRGLYNQAWERNWGFVPLTDAEIDFLARQLRRVVVKELVVFAERGKEPIGFAIALPDLNVALRANPSGRLFPGLVKVLWAARRIRRLRILLAGTRPEWRGKGVDALLYRHVWEAARAKGYDWAEAGWVLEDNHPMRNALAKMGFEPYKTYRLYERDLTRPAVS